MKKNPKVVCGKRSDLNDKEVKAKAKKKIITNSLTLALVM